MGIRKGGENGRRYFEKNRCGIAHYNKRDFTGDLVCIQIYTDGAQAISDAVLFRFEDISFYTGRANKKLKNYIVPSMKNAGHNDER